MRLPLYIVTNRKKAVTGLQSTTLVDPSTEFRFFKGDQLKVDIYLLEDAAVPTASVPYTVHQDPNLSLTAAIGNGIQGDCRTVLGSISQFERLGAGTTEDPYHYLGILSLNTTTVATYLTLPTGWDNAKSDYAEDAEVCYNGRFYRALVANPTTGAKPDLNTEQWREYDIEREPMYLEVEVAQDGVPVRVLQELVVVTGAVIDTPTAPAPDLQTPEEVQAWTDALVARVQETDGVLVERVDPTLVTFVADQSWRYQQVVINSADDTYHIATREIAKPVVTVATTNIDVTTTGIGSLVNGVTLGSGDRVLLTAQSDATENGIWSAMSGAMMRPGDVTYATGLMVPSPTTRYWLTTTGDITVGTTEMTFEVAHGTGAIALTDESCFEPAQVSYGGSAWDVGTSYSLTAIAQENNRYYKYIYKSATSGNVVTDRNYWAELPPYAGPGQHVYLCLRLHPDGNNLLEMTAQGLRALAPAPPTVPAQSDSNPESLEVGQAAAPGTSNETSRADHEHPLPGLATSGAAGFMSGPDKASFDTMKQMAAARVAVGFDAAVHVIVRDGDKLMVGGAFTTYGGVSMNKIARLYLDGRPDVAFSPGTGFDQTVELIAILGDGGIVVANKTTDMDYRGVTGTKIWKIGRDGAPDGSFTAPDPVAVSGAEEVRAIAAVGAGLMVIITPQTFRVTDLDGAQQETEAATDGMFDVAFVPDSGDEVLLSSRAYSSAGVGHVFNGVENPKGLRRLDVGGGSVDLESAFATAAGDGAEASMHRIVVATPPGVAPYAIVGTPMPATAENGVDSSWNGGSSTLFEGLYKILLSGAAATDFDVAIVMATSGDAPIPFFVDDEENIYLGGNIASINGNSVTANRLYKISKSGAFVAEFAGFNGQVRTAVNYGNDFIAVGGDFTAYSGETVGYFCFLNRKGDLVQEPGLSLGANDGVVKMVAALPSVGEVAADPSLANSIFLVPGNPVGLHVWNRQTGAFQSLSQLLAQPVTDIKVADVVFSPESGTAQPGGATVALSCPGFASATIHYEVDGSEPDSNSPTYSGTPLSLAVPATVKAFAKLTGYRDSNITGAQYDTGALTQLPQVDFKPAEGAIIPDRGSLTVAIEVSQHGDAVILWRDKFRTTEWTTYTDAIVLTGDTTLEAYATKAGYLNAQPKEARYNHALPLPMPIIEPRYSGGHLIGWEIKCVGADRLFYIIDDRPGELAFFGYWDHELEPTKGNNNGRLHSDSTYTVDGGPWGLTAKGIRVFGSSRARGLSPIGSWNSL